MRSPPWTTPPPRCVRTPLCESPPTVASRIGSRVPPLKVLGPTTTGGAGADVHWHVPRVGQVGGQLGQRAGIPRIVLSHHVVAAHGRVHHVVVCRPWEACRLGLPHGEPPCPVQVVHPPLLVLQRQEPSSSDLVQALVWYP